MKNRSPNTENDKATKSGETIQENRSKQGIDKMPEQEKGKGDKVSNKNLKGKQVDADPDTEEGKPLDNM